MGKRSTTRLRILRMEKSSSIRGNYQLVALSLRPLPSSTSWLDWKGFRMTLAGTIVLMIDYGKTPPFSPIIAESTKLSMVMEKGWKTKAWTRMFSTNKSNSNFGMLNQMSSSWLDAEAGTDLILEEDLNEEQLYMLMTAYWRTVVTARAHEDHWTLVTFNIIGRTMHIHLWDGFDWTAQQVIQNFTRKVRQFYSGVCHLPGPWL